MPTLDEFNNNTDISIGNWSKLDVRTQCQYAPIIDNKTKKYIDILTPELKKTNGYISGNKRFMYIRFINDNNYLEIKNKFFDPLANTLKIKLNNNGVTNNNIHGTWEIKFYNMDLSIIDSYNNITERQIISTSVDNNAKDINQYLSFNSQIKLNITPFVCKKMINPNNPTFNIKLICNKMLIINGINPKENIVTQPKVFQDFKKRNTEENTNTNDKNKEINPKLLELHKYKITNNYNYNDTIISI
jgi:hypothetical protein